MTSADERLNGNPDFLRKVASDMRHNRDLRGALELERIADELEALTRSNDTEPAEALLDDLHSVIWEAGKSAEPLEGYPVPKPERAAFVYGKDCATADIEQAVFAAIKAMRSGGG